MLIKRRELPVKFGLELWVDTNSSYKIPLNGETLEKDNTVQSNFYCVPND